MTDSKAFDIVTLIVALLLGFYAMANLLYYNRIKSNPSDCVSLTKSEIEALYWSSWVAGFLALVLLVWSIIRIFK